MEACEAFLLHTKKTQSTELANMYGYPVHSMLLPEAIFFGMLHSHLLTACFCQEQQSSCFGNNECFWHNLQPKQKVVHGP